MLAVQDALDIFLEELTHLKGYLALTEEIIAFGSTSETVGLPGQIAALKVNIQTAGSRVFQFTFDGAILILAANFEQFVTNTAVRFLETLPSHVPRYEGLPERIRDSNERYTGEALTGRWGRYL